VVQRSLYGYSCGLYAALVPLNRGPNSLKELGDPGGGRA